MVKQIKQVRGRKEERIAVHMNSRLRSAIERYCGVDTGHSVEDQLYIGGGAVGISGSGEPPPAEAIVDIAVLVAEFVASIENTFD
jgi:hypothetical protein